MEGSLIRELLVHICSGYLPEIATRYDHIKHIYVVSYN